MDKPVLPDTFWRMLAENNPIGMRMQPEDARAWFDMIWLKFQERQYRNVKRAIISWWSRVREHEIEQARERAFRIRSEAENERLEALSKEINSGQAAPSTDWASRLH